MHTARTVKTYLEQTNLGTLLRSLGALNPETLAKEAEYFTEKEAKRRDRIVLNYFGKTGVNRIVETLTAKLLENPRLPPNAKILDVGAGTGFFTLKIVKRIRAEHPKASFYAMDLTPAMLLSLAEKKTDITLFLGVAENIAGSSRKANEYLTIPQKFDAIFSTLMLHHSTNPEKVFRSLKTSLRKNGKATIVDMCEHNFEEFKAEMEDVHMGFKPEDIYKMAKKHFSKVTVEKMPGIRCECSGRAAEIFIALMQNTP